MNEPTEDLKDSEDLDDDDAPTLRMRLEELPLAEEPAHD